MATEIDNLWEQVNNASLAVRIPAGDIHSKREKLEKEIDRVIDVADGNANACNLLAEEIDRLKLLKPIYLKMK